MLHANKCEHEIIRLLLENVANGVIRTTHLMFRIRLNSKQIHEYKDFLVSNGLIELQNTSEKRVAWKITDRGTEALQLLNRLSIYFGEGEKTATAATTTTTTTPVL